MTFSSFVEDHLFINFLISLNQNFKNIKMGFASATREEKLKMMKTTKTRKITKKLNKLGKKKVISRGIVNQLNAIKDLKSKDSKKRIFNVSYLFIVIFFFRLKTIGR